MKRYFVCKRCGNLVQTTSPDPKGCEPNDEDRCPDPSAPGGYWYCIYDELVVKKKRKKKVK